MHTTSYLTRIARIVEELVKVPTYYVIGSSSGRVVFISTREGLTSLWSVNPDGTDMRRLSSGAIASAAPVKEGIPYAIYTRDVTNGRELHKLFYADVRSGNEDLVADFSPMRIFSMAYDHDKIVFTGATMKGIGLYQVRIGGSLEKLEDMKALAFVTDVNKDFIVGFGNLRGDPRTFELMIYSYRSSELMVYTPKEGANSKLPRILSSGEVLFESNFEGSNKLYIYNPYEGRLRQVSFRGRDYYDYSPVEHDVYGELTNGSIYVVGRKNGRNKLFIDGYEVPIPEGSIAGLPAFVNNAVILSISSLIRPHRIFKVDLGSGKYEVIVDNEIPVDFAKALSSREFITYKSFDGLEIPMYVVYSGINTKPGPSILYVHGGPWSEVSDSWSILIASLVIAGYHVLAPNFRGSTGYGDEFRVLDIGDPGGGDLLDVVKAVEWAVSRGVADREKVCIMGYSYGGYMTYLAMGKHPNLWRCGVAGAGVVDWEEMYELSDAIFRKFIEVLFANRKELLRDRSPIKYVGNVSKPLCIIHPQNDTRTPLKPVMKYISKLMELGKPFEAHIIPDMGHVIYKVEDAEKIILPALLFLERNLRK